ncbi:MAG: ABC transporter permease, partial [Planctomycetales bacterium]|nr:ABC transporter permease [Planctomycetales bacterium]
SVAISTRLPMMANFVICFAIYVLGHITPLIVQAPIQFAPVVFVGQFIATILPVLDHFNIQAAIAAGKGVPMVYLGWSFVYCLLYSGIAVLLALALFEDRDLA